MPYKNSSNKSRSHSNKQGKRNGTRGKNWERKDSRPKDKQPTSENSAPLSSLNDVSWYTRYPDLVEPTARIAFPYRPGMQYKPSVSAAAGPFSGVGVPGVMVLTWLPSIGQCAAETDPANQMARELFSRVRAAFSGSIEAEGADMVIQILALASIDSYIGALKRVYRILDSYSPNNYVLPGMLLRALGFSDEAQHALRAQKADFAYAINALVRATEKFQLPAVFDIINRHYWLNDNVYTDDATINSQFYVFNQMGFYQFATSSSGAGQLVMTRAPWETGATSLQQLYSFGTQLIDSLSAWDDCFIINGYFQRAFADANFFRLAPITLDEVLTPVYVPEVLMQIENSKSLLAGNYGLTPNVSQTDITQDPSTGLLKSTPCVRQDLTPNSSGASAIDANADTPLSIRSDAPTVADILIATRMMNACGSIRNIPNPSGSGTLSVFDVICGTEIMLGYRIHAPASSKGYTQELLPYSSVTVIQEGGERTGSGGLAAVWQGLFAASFFDWQPISTAVYLTDLPAEQFTSLYGDLHNVTTVPANVLSDIHRVCIFSEFNAFSI